MPAGTGLHDLLDMTIVLTLVIPGPSHQFGPVIPPFVDLGVIQRISVIHFRAPFHLLTYPCPIHGIHENCVDRILDISLQSKCCARFAGITVLPSPASRERGLWSRAVRRSRPPWSSNASSHDALEAAIGEAIDLVTTSDAHGYFSRARYASP